MIKGNETDRPTADSSVLVIGADGLIGKALANALAARGTLVYRTTRHSLSHETQLYLDLTDPSLDRIPLPSVGTAIFCAAVSGFSTCRADPERAYQINVKATEILSRRLVAQGCQVIFLSSSAVFDFRHAHILSSTPVCPKTVYGKLKALAEKQILELDTSAKVVRLTKVLSLEVPRFYQWLQAMRSGNFVTVYSDLYFCPISLDFAVKALIHIIMDRSNGIYQVSGADDISYATAMRHFAKRMGLEDTIVVNDSALANGIPPEEIATFTSLDTSRYSALTGDLAPDPFDVLDAIYGAFIRKVAV